MSKDAFYEDRYETPDRETVLEAENKRLKEMTQWEYAKNLLIKNDRLNVENAALKARIEELEGKWHYLPELPETDEVVQGVFGQGVPYDVWYSKKRECWFEGEEMIIDDAPYAWRDYPEFLPPPRRL